MPLNEQIKAAGLTLYVCGTYLKLYSLDPDYDPASYSALTGGISPTFDRETDAKQYADQIWDFITGNDIEKYH